MAHDNVLRWLRDDPEPTKFPYAPVVAAFHEVGKHFVDDELLGALELARKAVARAPDPYGSATLLRDFLDTALDKRDGRYDYPSYTALTLLPMPSLDDPPEQLPHALRRRDRLTVQLLADLIGFESASAADPAGTILPRLRPDPRTVAKRYRLAMHAAAPALRRLGLAVSVSATGPEPAARQLMLAVAPEQSALDRLILRVSMLPVYVMHDEYLFIRVLQLFETTFATIAVQLRGVVQALALQDPPTATRYLRLCEGMLRESAPLFSLLATMQVESFRTFREYTEGASAIQSRSYKVMESMCRRPDDERLYSPAYLSVPEVRQRVLDGTVTLDDIFGVVRAAGWLTAGDEHDLVTAMEAFARTLIRWRTTHYRLAVRMLGQRSGTGYTEGTPYLRSVQKIPVFGSVENSEGDVLDSF
ncbi:MAG TPA: hypothetical protein VF163_05610 [Micromonosporaceae bacterium]